MRKLPLIHALGWLPCWRCGAAVASGSSFFLALQGAGKPSWSPWSQGSGAWGCAHWHKKQAWQHLTTPKLVSLIPSEVLVPFSKTLSLLAMSFKLWACGIPVLCDGVDRGRNSCVFKKGSWFAVEIGYCVQDLMDCVCTHNYMRDKHNFSATSSLKELPPWQDSQLILMALWGLVGLCWRKVHCEIQNLHFARDHNAFLIGSWADTYLAIRSACRSPKTLLMCK